MRDCVVVSYRTGFGWSLSGEICRRQPRASPELSAAPAIFTLHLFLRESRLFVNSMGLRMYDIHTPTVPSGPTTGQRAANGVGKDKMSLMDLIAEKTRVEEELTALGSVLDSVCHNLYIPLPMRPAAD